MRKERDITRLKHVHAKSVFEELCHVVESWIVEFECLPETFYLALCCRFSNGTHDMF